jgi:hypothetical protein
MILVDRRAVFPEDMNIPFPLSLAYYPVMGFAVEILFHVAPLFILLVLSTSISSSLSFETVIWPCIFIVSLAEPIFQAVPFSGRYPLWVVLAVAFLLWVFNMIQLAIFKRYDFATMYSIRLVYYLIWHIIWGVFRLRVLF